jgi:hypothetical protein
VIKIDPHITSLRKMKAPKQPTKKCFRSTVDQPESRLLAAVGGDGDMGGGGKTEPTIASPRHVQQHIIHHKERGLDPQNNHQKKRRIANQICRFTQKHPV